MQLEQVRYIWHWVSHIQPHLEVARYKLKPVLNLNTRTQIWNKICASVTVLSQAQIFAKMPIFEFTNPQPFFELQSQNPSAFGTESMAARAQTQGLCRTIGIYILSLTLCQ